MAYSGILVQIGSSRRSTNKLSCKHDLIKVPKLLDATFKAPKGKVIRGHLMARVGKDIGHLVISLHSGNESVNWFPQFIS